MNKPQLAIIGATHADEIPGIERIKDDVDYQFATTDDQLAKAIVNADILLGWNFRAKSLEQVWPQAQKLRWIHWASAGVDAVLFPGLRKSDIQLTNAKGIFDDAMAEYVLGLILCFAKDIPQTIRCQSNKQWSYRITESIVGQSVLIVGAGSIGSAIAAVLQKMGMEVVGVARSGRSGHPVLGDIHPFSQLDNLLGNADYVINVTPSTSDTRNLFAKECFLKMKSTARFINVGRGDAVDEQALASVLEQEKIAGAALDVYQTEPLPEDSPLWNAKNLILSPHMSGDLKDYPNRIVDIFIENVYRFINGDELVNLVDKEKGY